MRRLSPQNHRAIQGKLSAQRIAVRFGLALLFAVLLCALAVLLGRDFILNRIARPRIEKEFAAAHPGLSLSLGNLHFDYRAGRLVCHQAAVTNSNSGVSCRFAEVTANRLEWNRLLFGPRRVDLILAHAELQATEVRLSFPASQYEIRCARASLSVRRSQALVQDFELQPSIGDEEFFAARPFRRTRFRLRMTLCRFDGLAGLELLQGKVCRARHLEVDGGALESVFNRDKPVNLQAHRRLTLRELLAALKIPLEVNQVKIINSQLRFGQKPGPGRPPRFLTFDDLRLTAQGIAYPAVPGTISPMFATAKLMNAGNVGLNVQVPLADPEFTFRYSGALGAMDLTNLNSFLEIAAHCRVKSGRLHELAFSAEVREGHLVGELRPVYEGLDVELLKRNGRGEGELGEWAKSFLVDKFLLRRGNLPGDSKPLVIGRIDDNRKPGESFLHFGWFALRDAILDVLGFGRLVKTHR